VHIEDFLQIMKQEGLDGMFNVVNEPEYSKGMLLNYQEKYRISSSDIYRLYINGLLNFASGDLKEDLEDWVYNYKIFIFNNGNIQDLEAGGDYSTPPFNV
jgi:hypothetical protein